MLKHDLSAGAEERLYVGSRIHLGDVIMSLNIMYNLSLESGVRCAVPCSEGDRVSQLMGIFDYGGVLVGCSEMDRRLAGRRGDLGFRGCLDRQQARGMHQVEEPRRVHVLEG